MSTPVFNFLGLSESESDYNKSKFVIIPAPYEKTTTYRKGTLSGPKAIIEASQEVELFDEELKSEPYLAGIHTTESLNLSNINSEEMVDKICSSCQPYLDNNKIICMLGGEHSISIGLVKAYHEKYPDLSVVQLDAHADLRDSYLNNPHNHACVMRRIREFVTNTIGIGIRNYSQEEYDYIQSENVPILHADAMVKSDVWMTEAIDNLSENVYLTIDCDYLDPAILPAVGTPEPGGGQWYQTLRFLKKLINSKNLVGFDLVELSPLPVNNISEFTAAKLIYKIIGYISQTS